MKCFRIVLVLAALTLAATAPAVCRADKGDSAIKKQCQSEAAQKGLGAAAHERYVNECVDNHNDDKTEVVVKGGKVSDADKQKLIYCGQVAQTRHLSGESFNRFMRECLSR